MTDNTFVGNTDGVAIGDPTGSTITGNVFRNNAGSGIYTDATSLAVGGNTAIGNGEYGIHAPAAIDLGGNVARGNGTADCVGLVCARRDRLCAQVLCRQVRHSPPVDKPGSMRSSWPVGDRP